MINQCLTIKMTATYTFIRQSPFFIHSMCLRICSALFLLIITNSPILAEPMEAKEGALAKLVIHDKPKDLPLLAFYTETGGQVNLRDFQGRVVLLNYWASWCAPCRAEMPSLDGLQAHFATAPFTVLAVSLDRGKAAKPKAFLQKLQIKNLAFYHDPESKSARAVGVYGLPTSLLIDKEGREIARLLGEADWHTMAAHQVINNMLGSKPTRE